MAVHRAAHDVADRVLGRLFLSTCPCRGETTSGWITKAEASLRELQDYAILAGGSPETYLQAAAETKPGHAAVLGQALAMLDGRIA